MLTPKPLATFATLLQIAETQVRAEYSQGQVEKVEMFNGNTMTEI